METFGLCRIGSYGNNKFIKMVGSKVWARVAMNKHLGARRAVPPPPQALFILGDDGVASMTCLLSGAGCLLGGIELFP
uniref:Uncharacterized protein n=1 Tax=Candidatus Kentrum sp. FW TaxID=2126338 RepID=A0A450TL86_9GAMM|nr:MAG: hypothetical protein BECKFW1821B_GA0114236_114411 [Candidatus Kentron sp. FW]